MKEALRIMKEQGKGFVKVTKEGAVWTDGRILVLDSNIFDLSEGEYSYQAESKTFIPGKMPDYEAVIPKHENGYLEVEPVREHGCLKLLKREYKKQYVVSLAGNGIEQHIRYLFFECLLNLPSSGSGGIDNWKASRNGFDPVLFFQGKTLKAVVMPIDMD